ncbi:PilX N-terminal domain-containing pilus assembly protein [Jeotgalibaca porci]|uniref:PilX N-terminal domain-containing pilus assembly protein n=1 Tax=Jeotgalibaca porci TaxID=1868793 RepID=UPI003F91AD7F
MHMLKQKKISENEQGSALVYTLMVLLLLSLLGMSVGMVTVGSYKLSDSNRDYTSAYYIAEAGANQVKSDFTKKVNDLYTESITEDSFIDAVNKEVSALKSKTFTYPKQFNEEVKGNIDVTGNFKDGYTIISKGAVGNKTRTVEMDVEVNWIKKSAGALLPELPDGAGLVVDENITMDGGSFSGAIYSNSQSNKTVIIQKQSGYGNYNISKVYYSGKETIFDGYYRPSNLSKFEKVSTQFDISNYEKAINTIKNDVESRRKEGLLLETIINYPDGNRELKINDKDNYEKILIETNHDFIFNTGGKDVTLFVKELDMKVKGMSIAGGGKLTIVVENKLFIPRGNFNTNGSNDKLNIVYLGTEPLMMSGWEPMKFVGNIIIPNANFDGNYMDLTGVVLAGENVKFNGGGTASSALILAPNGKVELGVNGGSYILNGAVVASTFYMSNNASLIQKNIDTSNFWNSGSSQGDTGTGDLIITSPIIEPN